MELHLKSVKQDQHPRVGFFVESPDIQDWVRALQSLGLELDGVEVYGLPTRTANVVWGCLVLCKAGQLPDDLRQYPAAICQGEQLLLLEKTEVVPSLLTTDLVPLFGTGRYVLHPEFGLVELTEAFDFVEHVRLTLPEPKEVVQPVAWPAEDFGVKAIKVAASPPEELLQMIKQEMEEAPKPMDNRPLNPLERAKMMLYKALLEDKAKGENTGQASNDFGRKLADSLARMGIDLSSMMEKMSEDLKALEARNKKKVDRLMDMLKNDPEKALRYAIPLDDVGTNSGQHGNFDLRDRGSDWSLFGRSYGRGRSVALGDDYYTLMSQYRKTAEQLRRDGKYEQAAYVYMKLLKDYHEAGKTLREGKLYEKAAVVFLKYQKDKQSAAECYKAGKMYDQAIELYDELGEYEKVGDLYKLTGRDELANTAYQIVVDDLKAQKHYQMAARLAKTKMDRLDYAQELLLEAWEQRIQMQSCLSMYFNNIEDEADKWEAIVRVRAEEDSNRFDVQFLQVLKPIYRQHQSIAKKVRDMAYEMVSDLLERKEINSHELLAFGREDDRLADDTSRYKMTR